MEESEHLNHKTETRQTQGASGATELEVAPILDSLPFYTMLIDEEHHIILANKATKASLGKEPSEILGQYCPRAIHGLDHPISGCPLEESLKTGNFSERELFDPRSGLWLRAVIYPTECLTGEGHKIFFHMVHDISAQKQAEEALQRSQEQLRQNLKMDALGRMARGVIHDFNNLLMVITGRSELAMMHLDDSSQLLDDFKAISQVCERASSLTKKLLAFSRSQTMELKDISINSIILNVESMLRYLVKEHIELAIELNPGLKMIRADPAQMEQVILNLVVNACDAMAEAGKLTVSTDNMIADEDFGAALPEASPGSFVRLSVSDTGTGMDEDTVRQLFEPFFTTKREKGGTGLGLAAVHGIVKQHQGWINVQSQPGQGSTFNIYLKAILD